MTENLWKVRSAELALNKEDWNARLEYLMLLDGNATSPRHMSNRFYKSREWLRVRDEVIERDLGCDLGILGLPIEGPIIVHHINPLYAEDIENWNVEKLFDKDNLICCSIATHNLIHYGKPKKEEYVERTPGDTNLWGNLNVINFARRCRTSPIVDKRFGCGWAIRLLSRVTNLYSIPYTQTKWFGYGAT